MPAETAVGDGQCRHDAKALETLLFNFSWMTEPNSQYLSALVNQFGSSSLSQSSPGALSPGENKKLSVVEANHFMYTTSHGQG